MKTYDVKIYFTSGQTVDLNEWQVDEKRYSSDDPVGELLNAVIKHGDGSFFTSLGQPFTTSINVHNIDFVTSKEIV